MCIDYTNLNKGCPKNPYSLPSVDRLVDDPSEIDLLSFMDAYSGYNQIRIKPEVEENTTFMTNRSNFCCKVILFGLKNAVGTYQCLMHRILATSSGR